MSGWSKSSGCDSFVVYALLWDSSTTLIQKKVKLRMSSPQMSKPSGGKNMLVV